MNWEDFEEYKIGEEKYDVTKMKDDIKLEELYSLLSAENGVNLIVQKNDEKDRSNIGETSADS
jgi:hypothetical protein